MESSEYKEVSKFTTLRVLKTKRNKIRRIAEKGGLRIESLTDVVLRLGLETYKSQEEK
uniref:Uncharacterized protein n=1 Tax=viral metagenome TaxID=1070528 RepID=A0A6M3IHQ0_9ZZZZ